MELFATPWFITLFASKLSLEIVYLFWEIYILEDDRLLFFFISLALLVYNKEKILNDDPSFLPQTLTTLTIKNVEELK